MKTKTIIVTIVFAMLIAIQPAQATAVNYSWYNSRITLNFPFTTNNGNFTASAFSVKDEGLYILNGDQFTTAYQGMVRLSGTCYQDKPNGQYLTANLPVSGRAYPLAWDVWDKTYSFSIAFPAYGEPVVLTLYGPTSAYNQTWCNLLFEAVG